MLQRPNGTERRVRLIEPAAHLFPSAPLAGVAGIESDVLEDDAAIVVLVDPETWLSGRLVVGRDLPPSTAGADLVVHGCSAADFRQVTRSRELPPLLGYASGRAWWWRAGQEAMRVDLLGS